MINHVCITLRVLQTRNTATWRPQRRVINMITSQKVRRTDFYSRVAKLWKTNEWAQRTSEFSKVLQLVNKTWSVRRTFYDVIYIYYEGWPKHLQLEFQRSCYYNLRSSDARLSVPRETDTFKSMAARSFNSLPESVRRLTDYHTFATATRKYLFQKLKTQFV